MAKSKEEIPTLVPWYEAGLNGKLVPLVGYWNEKKQRVISKNLGSAHSQHLTHPGYYGLYQIRGGNIPSYVVKIKTTRIHYSYLNDDKNEVDLEICTKPHECNIGIQLERWNIPDLVNQGFIEISPDWMDIL